MAKHKFFLVVFLSISGIGAAAQQFIKHIITPDFISEGVTVADVNKDGKPDILTGACWFEAPNWVRHAIDTPRHYDPSTQFSNSFLDFSMDVNQDGWVDLIRVSLPGEEIVWYENPGKAGRGRDGSRGGGKNGSAGSRDRFWRMHPILAHAGNESPALVDVDGDGRPDILCNDWVAKEMIWMKSPAAKGDTVWTRHVIARGDIGTGRYTHGLGYFDMNGDGRADVVITKGWWERPADARTENWVFHPADLGEDCAQIYPLDVRGNGVRDIITSSAHRYGIWWHEPTADPRIWIHHLIDSSVSETHSLAMADIDGDGHPDLVTGKRYYAHNGEDPGAHEPSVLNWFAFRPGPQPVWVRHLIDTNSGVGEQVLVRDMNGDGKVDIVVANKKGVFWFEQKSAGR
ncbi:MAG TPA: VCBS repeat-containing protein [Puia sp.]|nr:VCBS repeat-containing protein [Puia sp.]